jgi:hypothetical protein
MRPAGGQGNPERERPVDERRLEEIARGRQGALNTAAARTGTARATAPTVWPQPAKVASTEPPEESSGALGYVADDSVGGC